MMQLLFIALALVHTATVVSSYRCYWCMTYDDDAFSTPTDANCGQDGYDGYQSDWSYVDGCYTQIYDDGDVIRSGSSGFSPHCNSLSNSKGHYTECYCTGELCNNNQCQECGVTLPTEATQTTTTTNDPQTTTTTENQQTTNTLTTTKSPSQGLSCYTCMDCPVVDANTMTVVNPEYNSCFTSLVKRSLTVYRGGSTENHTNGECTILDNDINCYCNRDNCNDNEAL